MNCNIINYIILCFFAICSTHLVGQISEPNIPVTDSTLIITQVQDSIDQPTVLKVDSLDLSAVRDSLPARDSLGRTQETFDSSPDALNIQVSYGALDTQWYDHKLKQMHLFGEAYVNYGTMDLTAGYIIFDIEANEARAYSIEDSEGHEVQKPTFKDGEQEFTYEQLRYNFETNKGIVNQAVTQFTDLYVLGAKTKFIGGDGTEEEDGDDVIYNSNALITSCTHDEPHFGIRTKQLKVIPNKVGVTGPAQLEIAGVPTPLWLPFGFFPLTDGRSTGLKFPRNFPYQADLGFGVQGVGWYFPINDYMDLELTADWYTRGTWGLNSKYRYKVRYKYTGNFDFSFRNTKSEDPSTLISSDAVSWSVTLNHNQDAKAHPHRSFGGNINFATSGHIRTTEIDFNNTINNQFGSNFYYKHSLPNLPFSLDVGLRHRQNTRNSSVDITLPDVSLALRTIQPFKRRKAVGDEKWYEQINVSGSTRMANFISATDSTVFTRETLENMRSGISHDYNANFSLNVLKYFTVSPRLSYSEDWVFTTKEVEYDPDADLLLEDINYGFDTYRTYNAGVDMNTTLFGTILSDDGWFRGIRHTMKPRVGYSIDPDFQTRFEETIFFAGEEITTYSRFDDGPFGSPNFSAESQSITYGIGNIVELKYWNKKLEEEKKVKLLTNLNVSGSYNFAADSLNWSTVNVSGNTTLLKGFSNLRFGLTLDPYQQDSLTTIDAFVSDIQRIPVRIARGNVTLSSGVSVRTLAELFSGSEEDDKPGGGKPNRGNKKKQKAKAEKTKQLSEGVYESGEIDSTLINIEEQLLQRDSLGIVVSDSLSIAVQDSTVSEVPLFPLPEQDLKTKPNWRSNPEKQVTYEARAPSWLDLIGNFNINHQIVYNITSQNNQDSIFLSTHTLGIRGNLDITDNWSINLGNIGYDFQNNAVTYPYLGFTRKLHCWNLSFNWAPNSNAFGFFIGVNSGTLEFLKYNYGQNNIQNNFSGFR